MPEGINRDPKQNPIEKSFGILYIPDMGIHVKYHKKKNNKKRWFLAGTIVTIADKDIELISPVQYIDGIPIHAEIKKDNNIEMVPEPAKRMPLIHKFYTLLGGTGLSVEQIIDETIQEAIANHIDYRSEVPGS